MSYDLTTHADVAWELDDDGVLNLRFKTNNVPSPPGEVHVFISPRPNYCDRGHWQLNIECGAMHLDAADRFPRYYMRLETAIDEAERFLAWRLNKTPSEFPSQSALEPPLQPNYNGRKVHLRG